MKPSDTIFFYDYLHKNIKVKLPFNTKVFEISLLVVSTILVFLSLLGGDLFGSFGEVSILGIIFTSLFTYGLIKVSVILPVVLLISDTEKSIISNVMKELKNAKISIEESKMIVRRSQASVANGGPKTVIAVLLVSAIVALIPAMKEFGVIFFLIVALIIFIICLLYLEVRRTHIDTCIIHAAEQWIFEQKSEGKPAGDHQLLHKLLTKGH